MEFIGVINSECKVVISELNSDNPPMHQDSEFMELEFICPAGEDPKTAGLKVLFVKSLALNHKPSVSFYASLIPFSSPIGRKFYVIGSEKLIPMPDLAFSHPSVRSSQKIMQKGQKSLFDMIPSGAQFPEAMILLRVSGPVSDQLDQSIVFSASRNYFLITDEFITMIQPFVIDALVYSRKSAFSNCGFLETLCPNFLSIKNYILTEFHSSKFSKDFSINRCTDLSEGFLPSMFRTGIPTPNAENDCSGSKLLLHNEIVQSFPVEPSATALIRPAEPSTSQHNLDVVFEPDAEYSCTISKVSRKEVYDTRSDDIEKMVEKSAVGEFWSLPEEACETEAYRHELVAQATEIIEGTQEPVKKKMKKVISGVTEDWNTEKYFKKEWITFIQRKLTDYFDVAWFENVPDIKKWIDIKPNHENPTKTQFFCRICKQHYDRLGFKYQEKPKLAMENGVTLNLNVLQKRKNREMFLEHVSGRCDRDKAKLDKTIRSSKHQQVINKIATAELSQLKSVTQKIIEMGDSEIDEGKFRVTANMFRVVYAEAMLNIPLYQHQNAINLLKSIKANIGVHHFERTSAMRMLLLISEAFHRKLIHHIVSLNRPISIILDATTDSRGKHYVIIYFKALETDMDLDGKILQVRPCMYFYKLVELGASEDANAYLDALKSTFNEDIEKELKFDEKLKTLLVGFGSDGASVMIGPYGGLIVKLRQTYNLNIYGVHCMAHKFNLASGRAWKEEKNFKKVENLINLVYAFYNNRGHKRKGHLVNTASEMGEIYYEYSQIFRVRWIASEYAAVLKVKESYTLLITDLQIIINNVDKQFTAATVQDARSLFEQLTDKHFYTFLHFLLDVLEVMRLVSVKLQKSLGLMIGKERMFRSFMQNLRNRAEKAGAEETAMLNTALCGDTENQLGPCSSLDMFETSDVVKYGSIRLKIHHKNHFTKLSLIRDLFIDKLVTEIEKYFDMNNLADFDTFLPTTLPDDEFSVSVHPSIAATGRLALSFGLPVEETMLEWKEALTSIVGSSNFERYRNDRTGLNFYSFFLADKNIPWKTNSKKFIEILLVLPIGSADAERGFSVLKHIKYDRRARLKTNMVNGLMRLRLNGPPIEKLNALPLAKLWISKGHIPTDSSEPYFPRKSLSMKEKEMEEGTDYVLEYDEEGKEFLKKSNIFFSLK